MFSEWSLLGGLSFQISCKSSSSSIQAVCWFSSAIYVRFDQVRMRYFLYLLLSYTRHSRQLEQRWSLLTYRNALFHYLAFHLALRKLVLQRQEWSLLRGVAKRYSVVLEGFWWVPRFPSDWVMSMWLRCAPCSLSCHYSVCSMCAHDKGSAKT